MGNAVLPEYFTDQGIYYSTAAPNFYGYYCTGLESPVVSDGHHRFFGFDGQDLHYSGMQTESLPYVYYTPNYEYTHSPYTHYNPCNPCIPGAVAGVDNQFVGTQHYLTNAACQQPVSSPAFFPVVMQPGANFISNVAPEPLVFNPVVSSAGGIDAVSIKFTLPASLGAASSMQRSDSFTVGPQLSQIPLNQLHPSCEVPKGFQLDATPIKKHASDVAMACTGVPLITQARDSAGVVRAPDQLKVENVHPVLSPFKASAPTYNGSSNLGPNALSRTSMETVRPMVQSRILSNANGSPAMVLEHNRGPRMDRSKGPWTSLVVKAYTTKVGACNAQGTITICPDQYNREDFPVNYPDAKFFVIKSYSEDDVHKSIKYSVWSSTPNGNKKMDSAFEEAQRISRGNMRKCPVFLFFSVNGSGQFCGVAEMIGPVDFNRDMDFWQQDKWSGSFPVRWHIIKDVPNASLRHIILENNENRPVTNSRDTQEVKYMPGISMLNIFKSSPLRTSILDDFLHYEERQRIMYEEKTRLFGGNYGNALFLPAFAPNKASVTIKHPPKLEEKPSERGDNMKSADIIASIDNKLTSIVEHSDEANDKKSTSSVAEHCGEADDNKPAMPEVAQDASVLNSVMSLSIDSSEDKTDHSASTATAETVEYVTVGSMPIKVDGYGESSSGILTVGTIPTHSKGARQKHLNGVSASNTLHRVKGVLKTT